MANALDELLSRKSQAPLQSKVPAGYVPPSAKPAPETGVPTTPPGVVASPASEAVQRAMSLTAGVDQAADQRLAANPVMSKILEQVGALGSDYDAAMAQTAGRQAQMQQLMQQEDPARIPVPRLKPLPATPTVEEVARQRGVKPEDMDDPMRVFGQFMPVIVALGAGLIAKNGTAAINAATAAVTAAREGDKQAWEKAHKDWLTETKATLDGNAMLVNEYRLALDDRNATMAEKMSKIQALAAANRDGLTMAALRGGYLDQLVKLMEMRDQAAKPVMDMLELSMADQRQREAMELKRSAELWDRHFKMNPPLTSQDEVKAALARKVMMGEPLTESEEKAKQMLMDFSEGAGGGNSLMQQAMAAKAAADAAAAVGAGGGAPVTGAQPSAAVTSAPPAAMLQPGVINHITSPTGEKQQWMLRDGKPVRLR